jgi:hypothetical protein
MPQDIKGGDIGFTFSFEKLWVNTTVAGYLGLGSSFLGSTYNTDPTKYYIVLEASEGTATGDDYLNCQLKNAVFNRWGVSTTQGETEIVQGADGIAQDAKVETGERA